MAGDVSAFLGLVESIIVEVVSLPDPSLGPRSGVDSCKPREALIVVYPVP